MCLSDRQRGLIEHHDDVVFSDVAPFDGEGFDLPVIRTAQRELESLTDAVYSQDVAI